jgi:signal transduction histidine kinase
VAVREVARVVLRVVVLALGVGAGVVTAAVVRASPELSLAQQAPGGLPLLLASGWVLLVAGTAASWHRPTAGTARLCVLAALAWFVAEWDNAATTSSAVFTVGLLLGTACPAVVGHLALARSAGTGGRRVRRALVWTGYAVTVGVQGLADTILATPTATGCSSCPAVLVPTVWGAPASSAVQRGSLFVASVWGLATVAVVARGLAAAEPARRAVDAWTLGAALVFLGATLAGYGHDLRRGFPGTDAVDARSWTVAALALVGLAGAVVADLLRSGLAHRALARAVLDLGAGTGPGGLQAALAARVDDPDLRLAYVVDGGRLVDGVARPVPPLPLRGGRARSAVEIGGEVVAVLDHRGDVLTSPAAVADLTAAVGLALDNERLRAELLVQLADLQTSGARIVTAGDDERRRLEQDLHDGAQQRLVALALELQVFRALYGAGQPELVRAERELRSAVDELRGLARGMYPPLLRAAGLAAALQGLAETRPVTCEELPAERLPDVVESTVYLVVERLSAAGWTTVAVRVDGDTVVVRAHVTGRLPRLDDLVARVATLNGTVTTSADGEAAVVLRIGLRHPVPAPRG